MSRRTGTLFLEDNIAYRGFSFGSERSVAGEIVFATGMTGYVESLTDPSYRGQILVFTYPLIGNYGVPDPSIVDEFGIPKFFESGKIHVAAVIISDYSEKYSHYQAKMSLSKWLQDQNIPALYGIDTRTLTRKIRDQGTMLAKIVIGDDDAEYEDHNKTNLVAEVSTQKVVTYGDGDIKVVAVDCGMKNNIIRCFLKRGVQLTVVPWDYDFNQMEWDGLFISNGPGDPQLCSATITNIRKALEGTKPIFGICLGNQLVALAAGARTYKMKYGNRGQNQPCIDLTTKQCYITSQNHGFAIDEKTLPQGWEPYFVNANDHSNEGIRHTTKPFFTVQFHPEGFCGPMDTEFLFDQFLSRIRDNKAGIVELPNIPQPPARVKKHVNKAIILGSGALSIGQAGEFDYSGSQCIKALKEEGIYTILINPNIATIQTSKGLADKVYLLPVTPESVIEVIEKEHPDGILLAFGGQTALNCGVKLYEAGVFQKYNISVLGTPVQTIIDTEDRTLFAAKLNQINEFIADSDGAYSTEEAVAIATRIGYPVIIRLAYALGGLGSGFADNEAQLRDLCSKAFTYTHQVLVEKSLKGWKEVEYEVVRDAYNNCITVCNMENFDPMGIHTGESIVVAPSQTLNNHEYHMLRKASIKIIRHLGVVGECNIQYALDPHSDRYYIIEVNARLSRSSALASKATGYPLAFVAAKLALGYDLTQIKNSITKTTQACFEPALDYIVCKVPLWDLKKFTNVSRKIGSAMKSVGEVMSIGRSFEECFQKALRMVHQYTINGFEPKEIINPNDEDEIANPTDQRVFALANALKRKTTVDRLHELSRIDRWFLYKLEAIMSMEESLSKQKLSQLNPSELRLAKQMGFSDKKIAKCLGTQEMEVRRLRKRKGILPVVKQIDTHAAEFPAKTNYLYVSYNGSGHDVSFVDHGIMVLGGGAYRIGSSVEFDWCAVSAMRYLRQKKYQTIMVNYNPETVSTDYDECDKLYFEELSLERVLDIYEREEASGVIVSVGGQIPNNLAVPLKQNGATILGTSVESIDRAEDRKKFSTLCDHAGLGQPQWTEVSSYEKAKEFCNKVGYPCLIRPSYVLSGAAMRVIYNEETLERFLKDAADVSQEHPVVLSKFMSDCKEIELDAVASKGDLVAYAISEHIEDAGVHSGDATIIFPAQNLPLTVLKKIRLAGQKIAEELQISGPFNVQFLLKNGEISVIECNLRASRSFPFVSKVLDINFIDLAVAIMLGEQVQKTTADVLDMNRVGVKCPMFSFTRLVGADPILGVEMASTGEVACFGSSVQEAFLKGMLSVNFKIPQKTVLLSCVAPERYREFPEIARTLQEMHFDIYATPETAKLIEQQAGVKSHVVQWPGQQQDDDKGDHGPGVVETLKSGKIELAIIISDFDEKDSAGYDSRRAAVNYSCPLITNIKIANMMIQSLKMGVHKLTKPVSWQEHVGIGVATGPVTVGGN